MFKHTGFTLSELLIALAILGMIATFTIPKVLSSTTNKQNTAVAKEVAAMVSNAQLAFSQYNSLGSSTTPGGFTTYMNYVRVTTVDGNITSGLGAAPCSASGVCLSLHNGGTLHYRTANSFGSTHSTSAVYFNLDPDATGTATPVSFALYMNGRMTTRANATTAASQGAGTIVTVDPNYIQSWN